MRLLPFPTITVLVRCAALHLFLPIFLFAAFALTASAAAENQSFDIPALMKGIPAGYFPPGIDRAAEFAAKGDGERALVLIEKTRKGWKRPQYPDRALYLEALANLELGRTGEAYKSLKQSLKLRASNSDALYLLGRTSENPDEKLDAFTQAVLFNRFMSVPPNDAFIERIKMLIEKNEIVMATTILERAVAATPNFPQARIQLSTLYLSSNRQPDATKLLRDGLTYDTANLDLKLALARTLLVGVQRSTDRPQIEEASNLAAEVYKARPADQEVASIYARTLIEFSKPAEAEAVIEAALKKAPGDEQLKRIASQIGMEKGLAAAAVPTATATPG